MAAEAMESRASTHARLLERYSSYSGRSTIRDERAKTAIFGSFQRVLGPWLPRERSARILDIGCGEGSLLCFLRSLGYKSLSGFDISPENVSICQELGLSFVQRQDALSFPPESLTGRYDLIFLVDVVEHLPKQAAAGFLEQVREMLSPGGSVVIQTPNMGSLQGLYLRYCDLSHEFGLTEKSAFTLLRTAGFDANRIEVRAAWNGTTFLGRIRAAYLGLLHRLVFVAEGSGRPRIPTKNLLIRGSIP